MERRVGKGRDIPGDSITNAKVYNSITKDGMQCIAAYNKYVDSMFVTDPNSWHKHFDEDMSAASAQLWQMTVNVDRMAGALSSTLKKMEKTMNRIDAEYDKLY